MYAFDRRVQSDKVVHDRVVQSDKVVLDRVVYGNRSEMSLPL